MSAVKNYYSILNVSPKANRKELTIAYRKLALKYHPDLRKDKHHQIDFREINEAYKTLSTPRLRAKYDASIQLMPNTDQKPTKLSSGSSLIKKIHNSYWPAVVKTFKKLTTQSTANYYSELELSPIIAEQGGYQEFAFQIINQDSFGNEIRKEKKLKIAIPAKVKDGTILHLKGFKDEYIEEIHFKIKVVG